MKKLLPFILGIFFFFSWTSLQAGLSSDLMHRKNSVRFLGVGAAGMAADLSVENIFYNPALIDAGTFSFYSSFSNILDLVETSSYVLGSRNYALAAVIENSGSYDSYGISGGLPVYQGSFEERRVQLAVATSWSLESLRLGVVGKYYQHQFFFNQADALALDFGASYTFWGKSEDIFQKIRVGVKAANGLASEIKWPSGAVDEFEKEISLGLWLHAVRAQHVLNFYFQVNQIINSMRAVEIGMGTEYLFESFLTLRVGLTGKNPSFGAGLGFGDLHLDYAYVLNEELNSFHQLALSWVIEAPIEKRPQLEAQPTFLESSKSVSPNLFVPFIPPSPTQNRVAPPSPSNPIDSTLNLFN